MQFVRAGCAALLYAAAAAAQTDVSGKWSGIAEGPVYLVLKQDGKKLSGTAGPSAQEQLLEFHDGAVDGDHVTFKAGPLQVDAHVAGDEMRGEGSMGGRATRLFLKRADKTDPDARFEVATVKRAPPPPDRRFTSSMRADPGRITCTNVSLKKLVVESYALKDYQVAAPEWMNTELYNIEATMQPGTSGDQLLAMLRNLLADRFRLAAHRETKEMPVYALVVGKTGSKLRPSDSGRGGTNSSPGKIQGSHTFMRNLVEALNRAVDLPVVDMTGLKGNYDFTLEWTPDARPAGERGEPAPEAGNGPSIFTAIQDQLGLKLEARKASVEMLIVDHAEKDPIAN